MDHEVLIIGGGFGGLYCARRLAVPGLRVTLLDRRNFHLFQPLLYQVATGGLSPGNIAAPLRALLRRQRNARVLLGEAVALDSAHREATLAGGTTLRYDTLILATGSTHTYFAHPEWEALAPGLKTLEDAVEIRRRVLYAFEAAERETNAAAISAWLTFVIVGGGPTGVELAGAISEIARDTMRHDFRSIDPAAARIVLVEGQPRVLSSYPHDLSARAQVALSRLGVELILDSRVVAVHAQGSAAGPAVAQAIPPDELPGEVVVRSDAGGREKTIAAHTVLWAAGVTASELGRAVAQANGAECDRAGRVKVLPDCSLPGHPEIFVIGDLALFETPGGAALPGVAQVAMQQGAYVAGLIRRRLRDGVQPASAKDRPFRYRDYGSMATIGRAAAVADLGRIHLSGWLGWSAWLFIHLMYIVQFQNKLLVLIQWAWSYFTRNRSARLITGEDQ